MTGQCLQKSALTLPFRGVTNKLVTEKVDQTLIRCFGTPGRPKL